MKAYHNTAVLKFDDDTTGNAASGVPVTVKINSSQLNATIFDVDGAGIANPLTTDSNGNYAFKAADNIYDIIVSEGTANEVKLEKVEIAEIPTAPILINDLSQAYEFATVAEYKAFSTAFPVGKVINLLDRKASFTAIAGTGTGNNIDIIASDQVSQSIDIILEPVMTGVEFGMVSDFNEGAATGTANDLVFSRMMELATVSSTSFSIPKGNYLFNTQQTIRHNVKVDFNGSTVALDYTGVKNDSIFQMGNNTDLSGIDRLLFRSTTVSAAGSPMLKIGEFYAEFNGLPSSFENSLDPSYWQVKNVNIENVTSYMAYTPNATYKIMSAMVSITGGTNVTTNNITGDGTMGDGELIMRSVIRTETGYDINARQQGFDLNIKNTVGYNLDAGTEDAVVTINGDMNTKVLNVRGEDCAQILRLGTNGTEGNQSPGLRGKNGVNISAENIVGINCRKKTSFSPTHSIAGLNITGGDSVTLNGPLTNRTRVTVKGVYLQGLETEDATWSRIEGITVGDSGSYGGVIPKINRPVITDFEAYWFLKGMVEYDYVEGGKYSNGHLRFNSATGATLGGKNGIYDNVKVDNNNTAGNAFGFNSNGFSISTKRAKFNNCIFGDGDITLGTESQLSSVVITEDDTSATFENCYIANYKTGNADITKRGSVDALTTDIYIDQRCRGVRNISSTFPIAPDVIGYSGNIQANGTNNTVLNCAVSYVSAGRYLITFATGFQPLNANYILSLTAFGGTGAEVNMDYSSNSTANVTVYTKVGSVLTDAAFGFAIWADTPTIEAP